jgi:hypothetical protein
MSAAPSTDSIATQGNGTIATAASVATSVGQGGTMAPMARTTRAYS